MISTKQKIYINLVVFGIALALLIVFALLPQARKLMEDSAGLTAEKKNLQTLRSQVNSADIFQENYHLYEPTLIKIDSSFVDPQQPIDFVEFLEAQAARLSLYLKITPLSFGSIQVEAWQSSGFQATIAGSFPNCLKFLEKVENSPFLVEIMQVGIKRIDEDAPSGEFENLSTGDTTFTIGIKTFSSQSAENYGE